MKKMLSLFSILLFMSCAELQQVVNQLPQGGVLSEQEIGAGLRQALDLGIERQVKKLALEDGFFKNELVKILLPEELQKVDRTLRDIGLGNLADEGLRIMNRAAEDAAGEAIPIFTQAVREISFIDAKNILLGQKNAATQYLEGKTQTALYSKFEPVVQSSFEKVGADQIWNSIILRYNQIPLTKDVNPNLTEYVTQEALNGVFKMIEVEEKKIRTNFSSRTTDLLRRVFALQDQG